MDWHAIGDTLLKIAIGGGLVTGISMVISNYRQARASERNAEMTSSASLSVGLPQAQNGFIQHLIAGQEQANKRIESLENRVLAQQAQLDVAHGEIQRLKTVDEEKQRTINRLEYELKVANDGKETEITKYHDENIRLQQQIDELQIKYADLFAEYTKLNNAVHGGTIG